MCSNIIKDYTVDDVCEAIQEALRQYELLHVKSYVGNVIEELTWAEYGDRYAEFLHKILDK